MKPFRILSIEHLLDTPYLPVQKERVVLPNGKETDWFVTTGRDAAIVIPITTDGKILLQRAYKHGCRSVVTEFCAGIIEEGETPQEGARRELLEETGYSSRQIVKVGEFFANPTGATSAYLVFLALDCKKVREPKLDDAEQIENFLVDNIAKAEEVFFHPQTKTSTAAMTALFLLKKHIVENVRKSM